MPIDHTSLPVRAYAAQKAFYTTLLAPLGYAMVMEFGEACGFAKAGGHSDFWCMFSLSLFFPFGCVELGGWCGAGSERRWEGGVYGDWG